MARGRLPIGASRATSLEVAGRELVAFAGCDYLGLAHDPAVIAAAREGLGEHGVSPSASRETTGNRLEHESLEADLARFLGVEAALLVPDGYLANLVAAQSLAPETALALVDAEAHASLRDALLATGIETVEYAHCYARAAAEARARHPDGCLAIFTDGVFPALQRFAPLVELVALLGSEDVLVVDDCHGSGVVGPRGRGTCEHFGLDDPRIVITTTLSKSFGCYGGVLAGSATHVARAASRSRAYVCSTPIPAALARAGRAALRDLTASSRRLERLRANVAWMRAGFARLGLRAPAIETPVFAFTLDASRSSAEIERDLAERGFLVPFVEYPAGRGGSSGYFRLALNSEHTSAEIDALLEALAASIEPRAAGRMR
jgi:7-keto-8-aminopelargonate synthetase-like enzyme